MKELADSTSAPSEDLRARIDADPDANLGSLATDTDRILSIRRDVWRLHWHNQLTTAVAADANLHTTCGALLDALAMLETSTASADDPPIDLSVVNVLINRPLPGSAPSETDQAMRSMRDAVQGIAARIWYRQDGKDGWVEDTKPAPTWPVEDARIVGWVKKLLLPRLRAKPGPLALELIRAVDDPSLHLYPSEIKDTSPTKWALRIDGLQIGIVTDASGTLSIGKPGATGDGPQRTAFSKVFGTPSAMVSTETPQPSGTLSVTEAADLIRSLLAQFRTGTAGVAGSPITHRLSGGVAIVDEHALEARLLNGLVRLRDHADLVLDDKAVARGSQFPTLWGLGAKPRYLDALLRDGRTPLAVELKVATGGQGSYYRRSLIQAVLYRHFICNAPALEPWFDDAGLDRMDAQASIGIPIPLRWMPKFDRNLSLLRRVADRVGAEVDVLDDRITPPRKANTTGAYPSPDLVEALSWTLAAALASRWPTTFGRMVERHGGGGQYDELQLQGRDDNSLHWPSDSARISLNRHGSARVFSHLGEDRWVWSGIWSHLANGGDIDQAALELGAMAGLGEPTESPGTGLADLATRFLDTVHDPAWTWRCAWAEGDLRSWVRDFQPSLRSYAHEGKDGSIPTIGRVWGAVRDGQAAVIVDQHNLRVWALIGGKPRKIEHDDPMQRIVNAAQASNALEDQT